MIFMIMKPIPSRVFLVFLVARILGMVSSAQASIIRMTLDFATYPNLPVQFSGGISRIYEPQNPWDPTTPSQVFRHNPVEVSSAGVNVTMPSEPVGYMPSGNPELQLRMDFTGADIVGFSIRSMDFDGSNPYSVTSASGDWSMDQVPLGTSEGLSFFAPEGEKFDWMSFHYASGGLSLTTGEVTLYLNQPGVFGPPTAVPDGGSVIFPFLIALAGMTGGCELSRARRYAHTRNS